MERARRQYEQYGEREATQLQRDWKMRARKRAICPPAHRLIALHGERIVPVTALGLSAGRTTLGHRFLSNGEIDIPHADAYVETLRDIGHVQVDLDARRAAIRAQLLKQA